MVNQNQINTIKQYYMAAKELEPKITQYKQLAQLHRTNPAMLQRIQNEAGPVIAEYQEIKNVLAPYANVIQQLANAGHLGGGAMTVDSVLTNGTNNLLNNGTNSMLNNNASISGVGLNTGTSLSGLSDMGLSGVTEDTSVSATVANSRYGNRGTGESNNDLSLDSLDMSALAIDADTTTATKPKVVKTQPLDDYELISMLPTGITCEKEIIGNYHKYKYKGNLMNTSSENLKFEYVSSAGNEEAIIVNNISLNNTKNTEIFNFLKARAVSEELPMYAMDITAVKEYLVEIDVDDNLIKDIFSNNKTIDQLIKKLSDARLANATNKLARETIDAIIDNVTTLANNVINKVCGYAGISVEDIVDDFSALVDYVKDELDAVKQSNIVGNLSELAVVRLAYPSEETVLEEVNTNQLTTKVKSITHTEQKTVIYINEPTILEEIETTMNKALEETKAAVIRVDKNIHNVMFSTLSKLKDIDGSFKKSGYAVIVTDVVDYEVHYNVNGGHFVLSK